MTGIQGMPAILNWDAVAGFELRKHLWQRGSAKNKTCIRPVPGRHRRQRDGLSDPVLQPVIHRRLVPGQLDTSPCIKWMIIIVFLPENGQAPRQDGKTRLFFTGEGMDKKASIRGPRDQPAAVDIKRRTRFAADF